MKEDPGLKAINDLIYVMLGLPKPFTPKADIAVGQVVSLSGTLLLGKLFKVFQICEANKNA